MRQGYVYFGDGWVCVIGMMIKLNIFEVVYVNDFMLSRENC